MRSRDEQWCAELRPWFRLTGLLLMTCIPAAHKAKNDRGSTAVRELDKVILGMLRNGECPNWDAALQRALVAACCNSGNKDCKCSLPSTAGCNVCFVLQTPSWPVANTNREFFYANGITTPDRGPFGYHREHPPGAMHDISIEFPKHLCHGTSPSAIELLAQAMVHEALHVCTFNSRGGDGPTVGEFLTNLSSGDPEEDLVQTCFQ